MISDHDTADAAALSGCACVLGRERMVLFRLGVYAGLSMNPEIH